MSISVTTIPILGEHANYAYLLEAENGETAIIDAGEADPIIKVCVDKSISPDFIMTTHHHWDHVNGNAKLVEKFGCTVIGPKDEEDKIKHLDIKVKNGDEIQFGRHTVQILSLPGHTVGHIAFFFNDPKMLFSGDVLFICGCGRIFEGTPKDKWNALNRILELPDETKIYFGHEYSKDGLEFGLTIEPDNEDIKKRLEDVTKTRTQGGFTTPTTLAEEKKTNVFLRAGSLERFTEIRTARDHY